MTDRITSSHPGPGPFPAMLDLWGIGGGLNEYRSALLASKGIASLSLAYFGHKDIPGPLNKINVGDDYFRVKKVHLLVNICSMLAVYPNVVQLKLTCSCFKPLLFAGSQHTTSSKTTRKSVGSELASLGSLMDSTLSYIWPLISVSK